MLRVCHIFSVVVYMLAYLLAAFHAHRTNAHPEMTPIYILITCMACLHKAVAVKERQKEQSKASRGVHEVKPVTSDGVVGCIMVMEPRTTNYTYDCCPVPNVMRIIYYDDRGEVYYTEWQFPPQAGLEATKPNTDAARTEKVDKLVPVVPLSQAA